MYATFGAVLFVFKFIVPRRFVCRCVVCASGIQNCLRLGCRIVSSDVFRLLNHVLGVLTGRWMALAGMCVEKVSDRDLLQIDVVPAPYFV